jgi:hypothetical protein
MNLTGLFRHGVCGATAGVLLALPRLSVGILAWIHDNPFNGGLFGISTGILVNGSLPRLCSPLRPWKPSQGSGRRFLTRYAVLQLLCIFLTTVASRFVMH